MGNITKDGVNTRTDKHEIELVYSRRDRGNLEGAGV